MSKVKHYVLMGIDEWHNFSIIGAYKTIDKASQALTEYYSHVLEGKRLPYIRHGKDYIFNYRNSDTGEYIRAMAIETYGDDDNVIIRSE